MADTADAAPTGRIQRRVSNARRWVRWLKWSLCLVVIAFVVQRGWRLWQQGDVGDVEFAPLWLLPAAAAYLVGWLPSVWFWQRLMRQSGGDVKFADAARAYYCGHLGKYVPGKALVLVIRAGMLRDRGCRPAVGAITAGIETLLMMWAGLAVGAALLPLLGNVRWIAGLPPWLQGGASAVVVIAIVCILPLLAKLLTWLSRLMIVAGKKVDLRIHLEVKTIAVGVIGFTAAWFLHGLSLGLTIKAVGGEFDLSQWPLWTAAAGLATAIGFAVLFAPGGIGVREGLLMELLQAGGVAPQPAVAAAVVLRLVWLAAEVLAAAGLYYGLPNDATSPTA